jgi:hypothetical protein
VVLILLTPCDTGGFCDVNISLEVGTLVVVRLSKSWGQKGGQEEVQRRHQQSPPPDPNLISIVQDMKELDPNSVLTIERELETNSRSTFVRRRSRPLDVV